MSFLPLNVFAEEGQEAGETPEITENSTPAEGETDGDAVPAEGKETTPEEPETTAPENQENTAGKETEQPAGGNTEAAPAENKEENVTLLAAPEKKAVRTIMMYVCGSNLESGGGYASDNLKQILGSSFSEDEDVRLIVMTGGTDEWFMEGDYLCDPDGGLNRYVKWLNDPTSQWELNVMEDKWYAVQDAERKLHVLDVDWYPNGDVITNGFYTAVVTDEDGNEKEEEILSAMIFSPDGELKELYIAEEFGYRKVKPQDLKEPLVLTPITAYSGPFATYFIPISASPVTIDPSTCDQIRLLYTNVADIPDIEDTDGDGKALTKQHILKDIYNYEYDLSDLIENPDEELICIELTDVQDVVYNGEEQGPALVYDGEVLEEGTDYQWYATGEGNYTDVNEYEVILYGNGRFTHDDIRTYRILPASIEDAEVSGVEPKEYTGKPIAQNPEIKVGNRTLKAGVDYDITYENNTEIGTATMIIAGKGNYDGMIKVQFEIAKEVYSITYDLNGGSYNGSTAAIVEKYPVGTVIAVHEASVREGYTFQYWQGSSYQPGDKYTVKEDHTLTAQWKKKQTAPDTSDYNNTGLWAGLIAVSLAVLADVWFIRRKNG